MGSGVLADVTGLGTWRYFAPAVGLQRALDAALPGEQIGGLDHLMAWDATTGDPATGWPRTMEDLMFLTSPSVVDLDGDGVAEVLMGSGGYYLHAFDGLTGAEKAGWPKFTGHWLIATPAVVDWDGNGKNDVAITSREGWLFVWPDVGDAGGRAPWPTIHFDAANTGNAMEGGGAWAGAGTGAGAWAGAAPIVAVALVLGRQRRLR